MIDNLLDPPRDYSVMPFWFWNDDLDEKELIRQINDFEAHGVYGFVIHPRMGLPREIDWMSDKLLGYMKIAIQEAVRRCMKVILYDEGMYPSGSSCGQVVKTDPTLACRCLAYKQVAAGTTPNLPAGHHLVAIVPTVSHGNIAIIDRPTNSYIRGIHYIQETPKIIEDEPPAGDILNPKTSALILNLVHNQFYTHFKEYFGTTIIAVFTDEPHPLGKQREKGIQPGTTGIVDFISKLYGYDFIPHLPALWFDDEPEAKLHRSRYATGIRRRMDETWYKPLSDWCAAHKVSLCGHPADGDEIGTERYFHFPGQDIVWRFIEPDKATSLEGPESTVGKVTSSAMVHQKKSRNNNEFCGAFGNETTYEEFAWLADWLLVRGVNLLIPHAFYYSVKGPRREERPPDVGPHSKWWDKFKPFADHARRLSWINSDCQHICKVAIVCDPDHAPWKAAKVCYQNQIDFNYLDWNMLLDHSSVIGSQLLIADMKYDVLIIDGPAPESVMSKIKSLYDAGKVIEFTDQDDLSSKVNQITQQDVQITPGSRNLRYRHVIKEAKHYYMLFNETRDPLIAKLTLAARGKANWVNTCTGERTAFTDTLSLGAYGVALVEIE